MKTCLLMRISLMLCMLPFFSHAQWTTNLALNTPLCVTSGTQTEHRINSDGQGGAFIVWKDYRASSGLPDIYVQRVDSNGLALWTLNGIGACTQTADQSTPALVEDGLGGIIVSWSDWRSGIERDIYAQRIDGNGNMKWITDGVKVSTSNQREHSEKIISDDHGGAILAWEYQRSNGSWDIYIHRIDSNGNHVWTPGGIPAVTNTSNRRNHKIQRDGNGGVVVVFQDERNGFNNYDIYAQRLDSMGNRLWTNEGVPVCIAPGSQTNPKIDPEKSADGVFIAWADQRNGNDYDIYAQRMNANGGTLWGPSGVPVSAATGNQSAVDILSNNKTQGVYLVWKDERNGAGNYDIYAQKLDMAGSAVYTTNGISICTALGNQLNPNIISDKDSGSIIVWQDDRSGTSWDIYAQRIDKTGNLVWGSNGTIVSNAPSHQMEPKNVPDNKGGTIVVWRDQRNETLGDLYIQHLYFTGDPSSLIEIPTLDIQYRLYPNPPGDKIHFEFELKEGMNLNIEIYDMVGRCIRQLVHNNFNPGIHNLDAEISELQSGLYVLSLKSEGGARNIRFIKN